MNARQRTRSDRSPLDFANALRGAALLQEQLGQRVTDFTAG
jgi:hypothetical protein